MSLHTYMHLHAMWGTEQKQNSFHDQSGSLYYLVHEQCVYCGTNSTAQPRVLVNGVPWTHVVVPAVPLELNLMQRKGSSFVLEK